MKYARLAGMVFCACLFFLPVLLSAQTPGFPDMASPGTMNIPQPTASPVIPFIDLTVRNPETGQEVAFSLQLLLLITMLSLAPSILILMTSFL
ncbi:MAG: flagellar biosynthetic protein FliP, partial [Treponema sp.]|nr:flagellar biosynthetic protein FliP [Treponema sp.]